MEELTRHLRISKARQKELRAMAEETVERLKAEAPAAALKREENRRNASAAD
jgi:thymidylate synthase ThyX